MVASPTRTYLPRQPLPDPHPIPHPEAMPAAEPDPLAFPTPVAQPVLDERQQIVTISVTTGGPSSTDASSSSNSGKFPIAIAVPALVGGMALACLVFALWWWMGKRKEKKRRERWEAAQRRKRRRANSTGAGRPSTSQSRNPSATNLKSMGEKDPVPPMPTLGKYNQNDYPEKQYGQELGYSHNQYGQQQNYGPQHAYGQQQQYGQEQAYGQNLAYNAYSHQPRIDQYEEPQKSPTYSNGSSSSGSGSAFSGESANSSTPLTEKVSAPAKPSRSAARMAAAENAAARENMDANMRYAPKKPSPLALAAQEKAAREREHQMQGQSGGQEFLAPPIDNSGSAAGSAGRQVLSGEWGVALGSPNHDPSASFGEQQSQSSNNHSRYSNDPYLAQASIPRGPIGQSTTDPYAGYHDPVSSSGGKKRSNWV